MLSVLPFIATILVLGSYFQTDQGQFNYIRLLRSDDIRKYIDVDIDPCDDFYAYACGNWDKYHPIPEDQTRNNEFAILLNKLLQITQTLLETEESEIHDWEAERKAKRFYKSCMNTEMLKRKGINPLLKFMKTYGGWPALEESTLLKNASLFRGSPGSVGHPANGSAGTHPSETILHSTWNEKEFDWLETIINLRAHYGIKILLTASIYDDLKNVDQHKIYISEEKLSLPNRDFYFDENKKYALNAYRRYICEVLKIFGVPFERAKAITEEIINFEHNIALKTIDGNKRFNIDELLTQTQLKGLIAAYPGINWEKFIIRSFGFVINQTQPISVVNGPYISHLIDVIARTPKRTVSNYIMWRLFQKILPYVDDRFENATQKFTIERSGASSMPPRWKRCVFAAKNFFSEPIGSLFIKKYFDPKSQQDAMFVMKSIKDTFAKTLQSLDWVDIETKTVIKNKLNKMNFIIGHAERLKSRMKVNEDYLHINISSEEYFQNYLHIIKQFNEKEKKNLRNKVDKEETFIDPVDANAIYVAIRNRINIPAGILQYPFYHRHLPKAINFANIGSIIAHEITHGFDDTGRSFDAHGNFHNLWQPNATEEFNIRAKCFVEQYSKFQHQGQHLRSEVSQGEDIADNGGIRQAFYAYQNWLRENSADDELIENERLVNLEFLTNEQLFFISYAQAWCTSRKTEDLKHMINIDLHTPEHFRVLGSLANFNEFAKAFKCSIGSKMNPEKKCKIW